MPEIFYADEYQPGFGKPYPAWTDEYLAELPKEELLALKSVKDQVEANAKLEPAEWGWTLPGWEIVQENWPKYRNHVILGGNRSSKSTFCARLVVDAAMRIPEARIRCYSINEDRSVAEQQQMVWEALPTRFRALSRHKGRAYSFGYAQRTGFTGSKVVFPPQPGATRGSEIIFTHYASYKNDPQTAEGWWAHLVWCDEECPQKLFETLQYRTADARGRIVLSFTTLNGWTPLIAELLGRQKVLEKRYAPLLKTEIPYAIESLSRASTRVYFFWTEDQKFIPVDDFVASLKGRPREEILARAYGIPTKATESPFPGFDETVHVIPHEKLPFVVNQDHKVTRYHVVDPAGDKPWFMLWAAVDPKHIYIYNEWPGIEHGDWAEAGEGAEGKKGPAQRPMSMGFQDYIDIIAQEEGGTTIFERCMDPRLGATPTQGKEGATTIISEMDDLGMTFLQAPGLDIQHGLAVINSALKYDSTRPVDAGNYPKLLISDRCQNLIFAIKNYTNRGGKDEACKDPIDCLRYLLTNGCDFIEPANMRPARTFSYGG